MVALPREWYEERILLKQSKPRKVSLESHKNGLNYRFSLPERSGRDQPRLWDSDDRMHQHDELADVEDRAEVNYGS